MSWMNDDPSENRNYGFIGFSCPQEIFIDFWITNAEYEKS